MSLSLIIPPRSCSSLAQSLREDLDSLRLDLESYRDRLRYFGPGAAYQLTMNAILMLTGYIRKGQRIVEEMDVLAAAEKHCSDAVPSEALYSACLARKDTDPTVRQACLFLSQQFNMMDSRPFWNAASREFTPSIQPPLYLLTVGEA